MPAKTTVTSTKLDISTKPTRTRRSRKSAAKVTPTPKTVVVKEVQEIAPPAPKPVSYTHLTLPTSDLV